ncbi:antitoxin [Oceanicola sp. D3]|uniref:antitoxin n=1 Tax=Oceanicola sp. D3 TaxID=2587163 RepID=UPI001121D40F|nr:antitoxin [Oceanicola sp. D3]QDC07769.1 antitoxin [Oceanicola sp. D3]
MPRLSIDITAEEHRKLKAIAALRGQSIKDFVMSQALGDDRGAASDEEKAALEELRAFLAPRLDAIERGETYEVSMDEIIREAKARRAG